MCVLCVQLALFMYVDYNYSAVNSKSNSYFCFNTCVGESQKSVRAVR